MSTGNQHLGNYGEAQARAYLEKKGFRFVCSQWHSRYGELDLVMWDRDEIVFVEVKLRTNLSYGMPEHMVNEKKMEKIKKTAGLYLEEIENDPPFHRYDLVGIVKNGEKLEIEHLQDVFREDSC